jgi:HEAT repeat protein
MRRPMRGVVLILAALTLVPAFVAAQPDVTRVDALIRDLKGPSYDRASAAETALHGAAAPRARLVAGLIDALRTGEWDRCGGDMRDGIARALGELKAREAVAPLLAVVRSGKPIEHECAE